MPKRFISGTSAVGMALALVSLTALTAAGQGANVFLQGPPLPKPVQQRSYFLNGVCGQGTDMLCPGTAVPNIRPHSAYITRNGQIGLPPGVHLPAAYPVLHGKH